MWQVRNRFASTNCVGGYRDMNFKIRVGFKCDSKKGWPLFCSVFVALYALRNACHHLKLFSGSIGINRM
jgi:hypothetical protein